MVNKLFIVVILVALTLSACNGQGATETTPPAVTETQVATALVSFTEASPPEATLTLSPSETAVTDTPATPLTATATAGTPLPTNAPDCTNKASFVADITIPDNTNIAGGTDFTKTWRIANTGTCVWGPNYTLAYYSGERLTALDSIPIGVAFPGQNLDISVDLTAPSNTGTYQGNFVIKNPEGLIMSIGDDSRLWVIINVTVVQAATASPTATATAISNASAGSATATNTTSTVAASTASGPVVTTGKCAFTTDRAKLTEVITALNSYRERNGLPAYTVNPLLTQAAQRHANDIACNKLYVHTGSDGSTARTRVADTGYKAQSVSENVNGNYPPLNGQAVINWWINDKGDLRHGQNLLSTTFTEIGVGYALFDNYGFYALVFAKP